MMNREEIKKMFEMERKKQTHVLKNILEKPQEAGLYNIVVNNIRTIEPIGVNFDGKE